MWKLTFSFSLRMKLRMSFLSSPKLGLVPGNYLCIYLCAFLTIWLYDNQVISLLLYCWQWPVFPMRPTMVNAVSELGGRVVVLSPLWSFSTSVGGADDSFLLWLCFGYGKWCLWLNILYNGPLRWPSRDCYVFWAHKLLHKEAGSNTWAALPRHSHKEAGSNT